MTRSGPLNADLLHVYRRDGFLVLRNWFAAEEVELLRRAAKEDKTLDDHAYGRADGEGGTVRLAIWNQPGDGIYGMFARCHRITDAADQILDDEAYHYHSKMILKDAHVGGAWAWHQDYGYWYQNGVLYPRLTSVYIAVDPATRRNGCLQVVRGSHQLGRVDHGLTGDQAGADPERVAAVLERLPLVYCELDPGDVVFFDANTLHRSDQNRSDQARWAMICCYNAKSNSPYKTSHHPAYTPLRKVPDEAIKEVGIRRFGESNATVAWLDPDRDASATSLEGEHGANGQ